MSNPHNLGLKLSKLDGDRLEYLSRIRGETPGRTARLVLTAAVREQIIAHCQQEDQYSRGEKSVIGDDDEGVST